MRTTVRLLFALLVALGLTATGCAGTSGTSTTAGPSGTPMPAGGSPGSVPGPVTGTITVSAAASLTAPFEAIGRDFEKANPGVEVRFNFDSSATLVKQLRDGSPADGFASADEANMQKLTEAGLVAGTPTVFARNKLAIVVKKGNPRRVTSLSSLAAVAATGTISLCGADVPCGRYADQILQAAGVAIPTDRITRGQNVKATLAAVAEGDADAGIVYATDVASASGDKVEAVTIPDEHNAIAVYPIATVKGSTNQPAMDAFTSYVTGSAGQATLHAAGFLPPS